LRHLEQQLDTVRKDFASGSEEEVRLSSDVTASHLQRQLVTLNGQIRQTIVHAFGEQSKQYETFEALRGAGLQSGSVPSYGHYVKACIFDLHRERLQLLQYGSSVPQPGIDPSTDLYTAGMLLRFLEHEIAWAQRGSGFFGVILLRLREWPLLKADHPDGAMHELIMSWACVLKTSLRGYDVACRLTDKEFAAVLRDVDSVTIQIAVSRLVKQLRLASQRCLGMANVAIDVATAIYPFDGETVKDLLLHGRTHWNEMEQ
jgi:GGDEF domain-containing protein